MQPDRNPGWPLRPGPDFAGPWLPPKLTDQPTIQRRITISSSQIALISRVLPRVQRETHQDDGSDKNRRGLLKEYVAVTFSTVTHLTLRLANRNAQAHRGALGM